MIDTASSRPFDPIKDMTEVEPFGFVDLVRAYATGTVEGDIHPDQLNFNLIEDPSSIIGRPADEFDAVKFGNDAVKRGRVPEKGDGE